MRSNWQILNLSRKIRSEKLDDDLVGHVLIHMRGSTTQEEVDIEDEYI